MDSPHIDNPSKPGTSDILFTSCSSPPFLDSSPPCAPELSSPAWEEKGGKSSFRVYFPLGSAWKLATKCFFEHA